MNEPDALLRLFLVRHGVTAWNREMRFQGHTDIPLDPEGETQAQKLADRLARLPRPLDAVYSSDLLRAAETAARIAAPQGLTVQTTPLLRETGLGDWEGLTHAGIVARGDGEHFIRFRADSARHRPPGAEMLEDAQTRMRQAFDMIRAAHPSGQIVVVGHGGSLTFPILDALNATFASRSRFFIHNASLSIIEERTSPDSRTSRLALLNDISHLEGF